MPDLPALAARFLALPPPRVLVLGDLMLDRYTTGRVRRVSPEAPALVLRARRHDARPGGAASVAALASALDAAVTVAGVVGDDAAGRALTRLLTEAGVDTGPVLTDPGRGTTVKERFLGEAGGHPAQHLLRVDHESHEPLGEALTRRLADTIADRVAACRAVLVSDYGKGVCTPALLEALRTAARDRGVPVLIDPARRPDYDRYRGAALLKPNRAQAELATRQLIVSQDDALAAARDLHRRVDAGAVLVTLDRDGLVLAEADGREHRLAAPTVAVVDGTGAGDMALAVLGLCRAAGLPLAEAALLANVAAGLEVGRLGIAPVRRAEVAAALCAANRPAREKLVTAERLVLLAAQYRAAGKRLVFTNGCFDLLHVGHLTCLEEAARQGDVLLVAVNSDAGVRRLKGSDRPIVPQDQRAALLAGLECVDHVVVFDGLSPVPLLARLKPDVLVKGGTTPADAVVGREAVEGYGGKVHVTGQAPNQSTGKLLHAIRTADVGPSRLSPG